MKQFLLLATMSFNILSSCESRKSDSSVQTLNIEDITPGPIVHESLNEDQLNKLKFIQKALYEVNPVSLEETINNFKRDQNPDSEINIWLKMVSTYQSFSNKNAGQEKSEARREAFRLILMRSMMSAEDAISSSDLKILTEDEIQEILEHYTLDAKPLKVG